MHRTAPQRPSQPLSARRPRQVLGSSAAHLGQEQQQLQQQWPPRTPLAQRQPPSTAGQLQQQHRHQHLPSRMSRARPPPPRTPQLRQPPPRTPLVQPPPPPPPPRTPKVALQHQQHQEHHQQQQQPSKPQPPLNPWRQHGTGFHQPDVSIPASSIPSFGGSLATSEWATNRGSSAVGGPRPPPVGVRGSLATDLPVDNGANAFENDGRPGTRGGGTMYDLEGRPLTRGGGRPPSRMQMSAAAAAATTASTTGSGLDGTAPRTPATTAETFGSSTGPLTLPPRTYASVASPHHYHNHHHLSQSLGHPNQSQSRAQNHRSSIPAPPSPSSPSRSHPNTQQEQHHTAHSSTHASNPPIQQPSRLPQANTHHDYAAQTQQCQQEGPDILTVEDFVDRLPSDDDEGSDVKGGDLPYDLQHWMDASNPSKATGLCTLKAGAT